MLAHDVFEWYSATVKSILLANPPDRVQHVARAGPSPATFNPLPATFAVDHQALAVKKSTNLLSVLYYAPIDPGVIAFPSQYLSSSIWPDQLGHGLKLKPTNDEVQVRTILGS